MHEKMLITIKKFLIEEIDPEFVMLFGSYATGQTHFKSDVDVAFYKEAHDLSAYEVLMLAQELAGLIKMGVDLVDLRVASTVFKMQIFGKGINIYVKDEHLFNKYEMTVYRMYADLNEKRREVLTEIHESGTIYGTRLRCSEK